MKVTRKSLCATKSHQSESYLSPEGLEFMAHSMSSFAAMESSTLLTSLVKLPSTCLLLSNAAAAAALLCASDLSAYTAARCHVRARACVREEAVATTRQVSLVLF